MKLRKIVLLILTLLLLPTLFVSAKDINVLPYIDRGIKYYPKYVRKGYVKYGKASWYGKPFHGKLTANGERYNMYSMTAAHRTYAMGTILKVTNLKNKRSVRVRINDRGPFYNTRNIDLSYGAAKKLGMVNKGVGKVKIEVISSTSKKSKKRYVRNIKKTKSKVSKSHIVKSTKINKKRKIQIASFYNKKDANIFKKKHKLKNIIIVKKYIKKKKKTAYKVIVKCTPWEAKQLLKSKKFSGAYILS
ncbi:Rare lipoprotein A precursor [hydrothermal vent metagenome]|uniref:Rare lipoprotein A n=1 Tax=hydrothermal vent metagenome TaxID=652676 RepID=A0A1W1BKX5_9ZZZZ